MKVSGVGGIYTYNSKNSRKTNNISPKMPHDVVILNAKKPSFGNGWRVNKEKFDILEASETRSDYLGEVFRNASDTEIEQACKKKYKGFFSNNSENARIKLDSYINKAKKKMTGIENEIPKIRKRIQTGDIGLEDAKNRLKSEFVSKVNDEQKYGQKAENLPNAILILNDGEEEASESICKWLKHHAKVNYTEVYPTGYGIDDFDKQLKSHLAHNKKIFELTGIRSLMEIHRVERAFSKTSIFNHDETQKGIYDLLKDASDKYKTTILYVPPIDRKDIMPELFSKEHFDMQIELKDGIRSGDKTKLADLEFEKASMERAAKNLDSYVWYEVDSYDYNDDEPDPRDDWRDRM